MTMPMDIRICSEKTKWAFPFARRGIVFDGAASWFLPRLVLILLIVQLSFSRPRAFTL